MASWFSAKILFRAEVEGEPAGAPLCEESVRVLSAESEDAALAKAVEIGRRDQLSYENDSGKLVRWTFVEVEEVQDLDLSELTDGAEVYSRLVRREAGTG